VSTDPLNSEIVLETPSSPRRPRPARRGSEARKSEQRSSVAEPPTSEVADLVALFAVELERRNTTDRTNEQAEADAPTTAPDQEPQPSAVRATARRTRPRWLAKIGAGIAAVATCAIWSVVSVGPTSSDAGANRPPVTTAASSLDRLFPGPPHARPHTSVPRRRASGPETSPPARHRNNRRKRTARRAKRPRSARSHPTVQVASPVASPHVQRRPAASPPTATAPGGRASTAEFLP
jgi:hypothetical protein